MNVAKFGKGHHLQLVDGSGYIFRAFFQAERSLRPEFRYRTDGTPVGAIHFFCNMLHKLVADEIDRGHCTHAAVVFDHSAKTFRTDIYPKYKANRPPPPEDLVPQFPVTREATRAFNLGCLELEGYEADDIIATLATQAIEAGGEVTIVSSDKDLMQLVGDGVGMFDTMKNLRIGPDEVFKKFGVAPASVVDVQALAGDSTDNVPGAPRIGVKTAALLINEYGDLDTLLVRAGEIKQPMRRKSLIENEDQIRISRKLVKLDTNVPLSTTLDELEVSSPDTGKLLAFLQAQEFRSLTKRVAEYWKVDVPDPPARASVGQDRHSERPQEEQLPFNLDDYECVDNLEALDRWIELARERGAVTVDTETSSLDEMRADLVGVSLCVEPGRACYIPVGHKADQPSLLPTDAAPIRQLGTREVLDRLKPLFEDDAVLKIGQNIKFDRKVLAQDRYGVSISPADDTMLMSYALHAGQHGFAMDTLSKKYLRHEPIPIKSLLGTGKSKISFERVGLNDATRYASEDADITARLWKKFQPMLHSARVATVYETLERPMVRVLLEMERNGVKVDRKHLARMSESFAKRIGELESEIYEEAGEAFKVSSPKQLGIILFEKLQLPGGKKLKSGGYGTGADILEDLAAEGHRLPALVLDWRHMAKLKSTYTDSLQEHIHPQTGRIHTSYHIAGANTGRLASADPNLQNIPIRTEEGRRIREAFIAEEGNLLLSLDYSQIELRILAHIAEIEELKQAFREGQDIHALTASQMFDVPLEDMDPATRRKAKAINFGVIYGISGYGLARNLRIPRTEATEFIRMYFERFPGIRAYMDRTVDAAKENLFVKTMFGRKIHTPQINAKGPQGAFAKRAAINAPIQGSAADVIRRAMIRVPAALDGLPARMLLQVHDELIFEVREDAVDDVAAKVRAVMESADRPAAEIRPSLVVDSGCGLNWADAH